MRLSPLPCAGLEIARRFGKLGHGIVLTSRDPQAGASAAAQLQVHVRAWAVTGPLLQMLRPERGRAGARWPQRRDVTLRRWCALFPSLSACARPALNLDRRRGSQ